MWWRSRLMSRAKNGCQRPVTKLIAKKPSRAAGRRARAHANVIADAMRSGRPLIKTVGLRAAAEGPRRNRGRASGSGAVPAPACCATAEAKPERRARWTAAAGLRDLIASASLRAAGRRTAKAERKAQSAYGANCAGSVETAAAMRGAIIVSSAARVPRGTAEAEAGAPGASNAYGARHKIRRRDCGGAALSRPRAAGRRKRGRSGRNPETVTGTSVNSTPLGAGDVFAHVQMRGGGQRNSRSIAS